VAQAICSGGLRWQQAAAPYVAAGPTVGLPSTQAGAPITEAVGATAAAAHPRACTRARRQRLWGIERSHLWPPQAWRETAASAYMLRQHLWSNLYDRLSTRPFLATVEKVGGHLRFGWGWCCSVSMFLCPGDVNGGGVGSLRPGGLGDAVTGA
jgi:hypothetical protein